MMDIKIFTTFLFFIQGHHQEWLGSTTANSYVVAAFDFATVVMGANI